MREETIYPGPEDPIRVRVSGPRVGENKNDNGDRPCMWVFVPHHSQDEDGTPMERAGQELLAHEVEFFGHTTLRQDFAVGGGCPVTGAIIWLETYVPAVIRWRE